MNHPFRAPGVESLTDDGLQSITAPTVVIVAAKSAPFAPAVPADRARLIPDAEIEVIPGARHDVSGSHIDRGATLLSHSTSSPDPGGRRCPVSRSRQVIAVGGASAKPDGTL
jgi:hypothetical protein